MFTLLKHGDTNNTDINTMDIYDKKDTNKDWSTPPHPGHHQGHHQLEQMYI